MRDRDVVREPHGHFDFEPNNAKDSVREAVKQFILNEASENGYVLPMYLASSDGSSVGPDDSVIILPPSYSMRGLAKM